MQSYIYAILDYKKRRCYVGQSATADGDMPYKRVWQHYYNTFMDDDTDASIPLFQDWPLKFLTIRIWTYNDADPYGLSRDVYKNFTKFFIKRGNRRKTSRQQSFDVAENEVANSLSLKIRAMGTTDSEIDAKQNDLTIQDMLDIAEMIWISRYQYYGFEVLNKAIGGEQSTWVALEEDEEGNPQKNLFNINTTSPAQLTSYLISTGINNKLDIIRAQQELNNIMTKYLTTGLGHLIERRIDKVKEEMIKQLAKGESVDFSSIVLKVVSSTLKGNNTNKVEGLKEDLDNFINKYSNLNLKEINWSLQKSQDTNLDIINLLCKLLASSLLGTQQHKQIKSTSKFKLKFAYRGKNIVFKGNQGDGEDQHIFTIPLQQSISIKKSSEQTDTQLWWYSLPSGTKIDDSAKFQWAKKIFALHFNSRSKLNETNPKLSLLSKASKKNHKVEVFNNGDIAFIVGVEKEKNTLSYKLLEEYRSHLNYNNYIIHKGWHDFYSGMYSYMDKMEWEIRSSDHNNDNFILLKVPNSDFKYDGADVSLIGFKKSTQKTFETKKTVPNIIF